MPELLKINRDRPDPERIAHAAHLIRLGQVIAIPTDTLYGLAADPFNLSAVDAIFRIKGRPGHKPLLLMVNSIEQAEELTTNVPESFYKLARRFWPGPLTLVVPASRRMPRKIASDTGKVALREGDEIGIGPSRMTFHETDQLPPGAITFSISERKSGATNVSLFNRTKNSTPRANASVIATLLPPVKPRFFLNARIRTSGN